MWELAIANFGGIRVTLFTDSIQRVVWHKRAWSSSLYCPPAHSAVDLQCPAEEEGKKQRLFRHPREEGSGRATCFIRAPGLGFDLRLLPFQLEQAGVSMNTAKCIKTLDWNHIKGQHIVKVGVESGLRLGGGCIICHLIGCERSQTRRESMGV